MAVATAAHTPTIPISPTPLIPIGLTLLSGSSTKMTLMSCTSACTGLRTHGVFVLGRRHRAHQHPDGGRCPRSAAPVPHCWRLPPPLEGDEGAWLESY